MINAIHSFFLFLGKHPGTLFKNFIYLLIFSLITYMLISEYNKKKKHEYKYLIIAFGALSLQALVNTTLFSLVVFMKLDCNILEPILPLSEHALELFALVLLSNAFIYPLFKNKEILKNKIYKTIISVSILTLIIDLLWMNSWTNNPSLLFNQNLGFGIFMVVKLALLANPIYKILFSKEKMRYKHLIYIAFIFYAIAPLTTLLNYIIFNSTSVKLDVFIQPWPFLSALMFLRIIYLKLVDKIFLKNKLRESNLKYIHEKELNALKDEFVSVVSHELRTPLTSIKLYISLLKDGQFGKVNKEQLDALKVVNDESDRLTNLINDILDLNKLESGKATLCLSKLNLNELKESIYFGLAQKKQIKVNFNIPKDAIVTVDSNRIKQVYINLMNNASKFTEKKGKIDVTIKKNKKNWQMIIKDTGQGISETHLPKLFEKFYQIQQDHMTRTVKGTGLGLAIVKKIVDMHSGSIYVESQVKKGTTFILTFPVFNKKE